MPFPDWMPQYEICFPIESKHFGPSRLQITPKGYEKDTGGGLAPDHRNRVYGIYVTARFEDEGRGLKYDISDFIQPECFRELEAIVAESENEKPPAQFVGDDGYIDIHFSRVTDHRLRILCLSPSLGWNVTCLRLEIEGFVTPESLAEPLRQIHKLLEVVGQIDSGSMEA